MHRSTNVLLLIIAALAATSIWLRGELLEERDRADSLQARIDEPGGVDADAVPAPAGPTDAVPAGSVAAAAGDDTAQLPKAEDLHADERRLLRNDAYREARRRFRQLELARGHIDLARVLGISQETADRLLAMLVDRELAYSEKPFRNPRNEKEVRQRQMDTLQAQHENDARIAAVIGSANLPRWKEYQASLRERHWVNDMSARMIGEAESLRADQVDQLVAAMYAERRRAEQELSEFSENLTWSDGMEPKSRRYRDERHAELARVAEQRLLAAASSILSAKQLAYLDDRMKRERELEDAEAEQSRAFDEAARISGGSG